MAKTKKLPKIIQDIRRYKVPPIDWNNQKIISHTQMTIFNQCPFRWGSHYRDGHKTFTPSISLIFGTAIHETLQNYIVKFYEESKAAADRMDLEIMFKDRLRSLYKENFDKNPGKQAAFENLRFLQNYQVNLLPITLREVTDTFKLFK